MNMSLPHWSAQVLRRAQAPMGELAVGLHKSAADLTDFRARAHAVHIDPREDGMTDQVLTSLASQIKRLEVRPLSAAKEVKTGADWEWWIQGRSRWFGFLVQAKKLHLGAAHMGKYHIGYRPKKAKRTQLEALERASHNRSIPAIYALYNFHAPSGSFSYHGSASCVPSDSDRITAISAHAAKRALRSSRGEYVDLARVAPHALPFSCIAACLCGSHFFPFGRDRQFATQDLGFDEVTADDDPALVAARFVLRLSYWTGSNDRFDAAGAAEHAMRLVVAGVRDRLPDYVLRALRDEVPPTARVARNLPRYLVVQPIGV